MTGGNAYPLDQETHQNHSKSMSLLWQMHEDFNHQGNPDGEFTLQGIFGLWRSIIDSDRIHGTGVFTYIYPKINHSCR